MTAGIKIETGGYSFEAPHLSSGRIHLMNGDLIEVFDIQTGKKEIIGKVVDLKPQYVTVSPLSDDQSSFIATPDVHGFKAAYT